MPALKSLMKIYRNKGAFSTTTDVLEYFYYYSCAILKFWQKPIFSNLEELVDFSLTGLGGLITPLQIRKEFIAFLELIQ
ncbi:MAG: hypothetical protein JSU85_10495, partial [Candidatus Zixiibacteriota bacterium]